jgi:hypothetical protein
MKTASKRWAPLISFLTGIALSLLILQVGVRKVSSPQAQPPELSHIEAFPFHLAAPAFPSDPQLGDPLSEIGQTQDGPLSESCPPALKLACHRLQTLHPEQAAPLFKAYLREHPDCLPAYVGLVQSDVPEWSLLQQRVMVELSPLFDLKTGVGYDPQETDTTEMQASLRPKFNPESPVFNFHMGVLLYYAWAWQKQNETITFNRTEVLYLAQAHLRKAFKFLRTPFVGHFLGMVEDQIRWGHEETPITETLLKTLCGEKAYNFYLKAKASDFSGELPMPVELVPKENRQALLREVENMILSDESGPSVTRQVDEHTFASEPGPPTEYQKREGTFFKLMKQDLQRLQKSGP